MTAVCLCQDGDRVLLENGHDRATGESFLRAIGGGVEFGERAEDAVRREWKEELGADLADLRLLGVIENLFAYDGRPGHEVVFVFTGTLARPLSCAARTLEFFEADGTRHVAEWVDRATGPGSLRLLPAGLGELWRAIRPGPSPRSS